MATFYTYILLLSLSLQYITTSCSSRSVLSPAPLSLYITSCSSLSILPPAPLSLYHLLLSILPGDLSGILESIPRVLATVQVVTQLPSFLPTNPLQNNSQIIKENVTRGIENSEQILNFLLHPSSFRPTCILLNRSLFKGNGPRETI